MLTIWVIIGGKKPLSSIGITMGLPSRTLSLIFLTISWTNVFPDERSEISRAKSMGTPDSSSVDIPEQNFSISAKRKNSRKAGAFKTKWSRRSLPERVFEYFISRNTVAQIPTKIKKKFLVRKLLALTKINVGPGSFLLKLSKIRANLGIMKQRKTIIAARATVKSISG